jgi:ABC-2 type transport system permease protein
MLDSLRTALLLAAASVRGQMRFRASILLMAGSQFLMTGIDFLAVWALFHRFGNIRGWTLPEVAYLYGLLCLGFALAETAGRGFDTFGNLVKSGDFDRLLLRPRSAALQLAGREFRLASQGRGLQGLVVLSWAALELGVPGSPWKTLLTAGALAGTALLFYGMLIIQATLCFWTVDSLEMVNIVTYGGIETAQFPMDIYPPWVRRLFTFVVPLALVSFFPARAVFGRIPGGDVSILLFLGPPLAGAAFLALALLAWTFGVRHYQSTGS